MTDIRPLAGVDGRDRPEVGGKCASLGEMLRAGVQVPDGFAITVTACQRFMDANQLGPRVHQLLSGVDPADLAGLETVCHRVREAIESAPLPEEISAQVTAAYELLRGPSPDLPVAVRSSAVAEDSETASFAGQQETYLWIQGAADVLRHVRRCWASLYTPQAVVYRARVFSQPPGEALPSMAVCVQRMVDARVAGVMFTLSPRTGDLSTIAINAAWGLGVGVVGGEITPDEYWVDKVTLEIRNRNIFPKPICYAHDAAQGGVVCQAVPAELQSAPCLTDEEAAELARVGKQLEALYGRPQDVEWAIARDATLPQSLFILQSRPETSWSRRSTHPLVEKASQPLDYVMRTFLRR